MRVVVKRHHSRVITCLAAQYSGLLRDAPPAGDTFHLAADQAGVAALHRPEGWLLWCSFSVVLTPEEQQQRKDLLQVEGAAEVLIRVADFLRTPDYLLTQMWHEALLMTSHGPGTGMDRVPVLTWCSFLATISSA